MALFLTGCNQEDKMGKKEIENTASNVATEYLKVYEKIDFVVTDVEFSGAIGSSTVFVNGHIKGDEAKKMSVTIDYENDYKVSGYGEGSSESIIIKSSLYLSLIHWRAS
jgi:hypothetical protein